MAASQPEGYLATPATGSGAPVLVLHAWWGLNDTMKRICDRLAEAGFTAFAPDLYHGQVADTIEGAQALAKALDDASSQADINKSIDFLVDGAANADRGVAVVGFSMGAYYSLELAAADPERIHSVVIFYGTGPTEHGKSRAAYLGHFAENDDFEPKSAVDELEESLKAAGRPVSFYTYPETGHWFFEADRADAYDQAAAELAWERTLEYLKSS
jgi:carboxymethylenebutenolidase